MPLQCSAVYANPLYVCKCEVDRIEWFVGDIKWEDVNRKCSSSPFFRSYDDEMKMFKPNEGGVK